MSDHTVRELIHVKGLKEFKRRLEELPKALGYTDDLDSLLTEIGEFLQREARENLPSHWLLTEAIGFEVEENGGVRVGPRYGYETNVGDPVEYGIYHEFGTSGYKKTPKPDGKGYDYYYQGPTPARQYLERAINENQAKIERIIADHISDILERRQT